MEIISSRRDVDPVLALAFAATGEPATRQALPREFAACAGMPARRQMEWLAGRLAARRALEALGRHGEPVLADGARPRFPPGLHGSISHSAGIAVSLVATSDAAASAGVDIERRRVSLRALELVAAGSEREWVLAAASEEERRDRLTTLWSAKESAFKALSATGAAPATVAAVALLPAGPHEFAGRCGKRYLRAGCATVGPFLLTWALEGAAASTGVAETVAVIATAARA